MQNPFAKKIEKAPEREEIAVILASPQQGLTSEEARARAEAGWRNLPVEPPTRTRGEIIRANVFTYFNAVFAVLAVCLVAVRASILNLSFLVVVIVNTVIGITQELKSKKALDELSILAIPRVTAIRNGRQTEIATTELVRDDIVYLALGDQVCADAVVVEGECQVNEALVTGESDEIKKEAGDSLLSGSFLVSGCCTARLTAVGADSFVNRLTLEAKKQKKAEKHGMIRALNDLVKWIGVALVPIGALLLWKEVFRLERDVATSVTSTVGALVGMIPEGVYLLTSLALTAGVLRLAKKNTMCREMGCIETLSRVDVLCVDKTGTVTENKMIVEDVIPLCPDRFEESDIRMIMADYVAAMQSDNDTMTALRRYFTGEAQQEAIRAMGFSSKRKYGGVSFHEDETYLLGAPEILLGDRFADYEEQINEYSSRGCRVLLLTLYDGYLFDEELCSDNMPLALILLSNKIRPGAPETFAYFAEQGVSVRVISGDNPLTVSEVARRAGIPGAEKAVDTRSLETDEDVYAAARENVVFGRVTPDMKRKLVLALKAQGHTVAMTGDGVNDVLALKEADCSIAMASGSDVACQVSQIVLTESDFTAMPSVVAEGRRVINNIERSASLYLVKNTFSFAMAIISLLFTLPYPLSPAQLGLVNCMTIGIPAFFLAMEPNENRVQGKFLKNVLRRALPAALTDLVLVCIVMLFYLAARLDDTSMSTICAGVMGVVGLYMVYETVKPLDRFHTILLAALAVGFVLCFCFMKGLFNLIRLDFLGVLVLCVTALLAGPVMGVVRRGLERARELSARLPGRAKKKLYEDNCEDNEDEETLE